MNIKIKATRDFTVGPFHKIVINKGDTREVEMQGDSFCTETNDGSFFGVCNINNGWEKVDVLLRVPKRLGVG